MNMSTRELTFAQAIREALDEELARDERIVLFGEDIGAWGGVFRTTEGLYEKYGPDRVIDTPLSEEGYVGMAVGIAMTGMHPVPEIMFGDFITLAMDQIVNQAAKMRYMTGGQVAVPITIRATMGGGRSSGAQHSQSWHAWFAHVPGLKVVVPSTPYDAKGLLKTALRDPNPVVFFEDKVMYHKIKGPVPEEEYLIPFGVADIKREGKDVTIIALSRMVHTALAAAERLAQEGISAEVVDPRTLTPLDEETLVQSVCKTGGAVIVDEGYTRFGITAELAAVIAKGAFDYLDAPIERVGAFDVPIPFSPPLEFATIPDEERIVQAVYRILEGRRPQ
ncbi:MAG: alpha-ketoacid dehydrogenase subunit beta [Anaerolineales bacterium]|nr:alpha-ketoacid dehydrogenase subunit beta [Anaerolineales bacterium]MDW8447440.1 alpha-ketoacid dehydrogenase subunit beta [Anaerolineales bacterium]